MKYARKFILVPADSKPKPVELKQSMRHVLKGRRDHRAAKKMSHLLSDYLHYNKKPAKPIDFSKHIPAIYHNKMNILLKEVTWTPLAELKTQFGKVIAGSNMIELIREAIVGKRKQKRTHTPHGWEAFIEQLAASTIPLSFFTKESTRQDIERLRWRSY